MTDIDQRLSEAYDSVRLPDDVRAQTLAAIEAARCGAPVTVAASRRRPQRLLALAACLLLVLAGIGGFGAFRAYGTPAAYVDISVNPAIQLTVNASGTVISAEGLNEDGKSVLATVNVAHCSYGEAMDAIMTSAIFLSYINKDSLIDVSIASDDEQLGTALAEQTDATLANVPCQHQCHRADGTTCGGGQGTGNGPGMGAGHQGGSGAGHGHQHHGAGAS